MAISVQDKSNYLKGLLIIAKVDKHLAEPEKNIIRKIAKKLGFASDFYEQTLLTLLNNEYIATDPIKFSGENVAKSFIRDGLRLAYADHELTRNEIEWLRSVCEVNNIGKDWFSQIISESVKSKKKIDSAELEIYSIL